MILLLFALISIVLVASGVCLTRLGFERLGQFCLVCSFLTAVAVSATIGTETAI